MSAVDEYRSGTESFNRAADQRILSEIAGPAHYVMHLADAAIAELEAAIAVERNLVTSAHRAENAKQQALDAERHRAESAEAELHDFKSRHTAAGCGMDVTTGSLHVMTTGAGYVNGAFCVNDVPNSFDHGEE